MSVEAGRENGDHIVGNVEAVSTDEPIEDALLEPESDSQRPGQTVGPDDRRS